MSWCPNGYGKEKEEWDGNFRQPQKPSIRIGRRRKVSVDGVERK